MKTVTLSGVIFKHYLHFITIKDIFNDSFFLIFSPQAF